MDRTFDRIRRIDLRSLAYTVAGDHPEALTADERKPRSYTWSCPVRLDQGREGACVGFGCAHERAARPASDPTVSNEMAREHYFAAQRRDPWPGGAYPGADPFMEGSSVTAGVMVAVDEGLIDAVLWATTVEEVALAVGYRGPVVAGTDWLEGMLTPDADGWIHATGRPVGGHCYLIVGVKIVWLDAKGPRTWANVDMLRSYFTILNSWGPPWGLDGTALIAFADYATLVPGSELAVPVGRHTPRRQAGT